MESRWLKGHGDGTLRSGPGTPPRPPQPRRPVVDGTGRQALTAGRSPDTSGSGRSERAVVSSYERGHARPVDQGRADSMGGEHRRTVIAQPARRAGRGRDRGHAAPNRVRLSCARRGRSNQDRVSMAPLWEIAQSAKCLIRRRALGHRRDRRAPGPRRERGGPTSATRRHRLLQCRPTPAPPLPQPRSLGRRCHLWRAPG